MLYPLSRDGGHLDGACDGVFVGQQRHGFCGALLVLEGDGGGRSLGGAGEAELHRAGAAQAKIAEELVLEWGEGGGVW